MSTAWISPFVTVLFYSLQNVIIYVTLPLPHRLIRHHEGRDDIDEDSRNESPESDENDNQADDGGINAEIIGDSAAHAENLSVCF